MTASTAVYAPIPLLDLRAQYATIRDEVTVAIAEVCESQRFIGGPEVVACEEEIAAYCGCRHGIGVSSGTDALLVGMMAMGIGPGDEVIVPALTFFATGGCVARLGATPVFVDIDPKSFNVTAKLIEPAITERTKLIIPVHLYGQCAEMENIMALADRRGIPVLEDAAQSIGAERNGRKAGQFGRLTTFSFFPSKNLGAFGDGGMIVTDDTDLADRLRLLRDHGASPKYYHSHVGGNFRLDAIQAAVLRVKLRHLDDWSRRRAENARRYGGLLGSGATVFVRTPVISPGNVSIYNQYVIRAPRRDALRRRLTECRIGTEIYYPLPLHLQACFAHLGGKAGDCPIAEQAADEVLALPVYPELTLSQQQRVAETIKEFYATGA
jgi:dTDP-4-amino-4,6-dideoxygalactose transaminase